MVLPSSRSQDSLHGKGHAHLFAGPTSTAHGEVAILRGCAPENPESFLFSSTATSFQSTFLVRWNSDVT